MTNAAIVQVAAQAVQLRQDLTVIFHKMPHDLQQTMLSSPHRAALLQLPSSEGKVSHCPALLLHGAYLALLEPSVLVPDV